MPQINEDWIPYIKERIPIFVIHQVQKGSSAILRKDKSTFLSLINLLKLNLSTFIFFFNIILSLRKLECWFANPSLQINCSGPCFKPNLPLGLGFFTPYNWILSFSTHTLKKKKKLQSTPLKFEIAWFLYQEVRKFGFYTPKVCLYQQKQPSISRLAYVTVR